MLRLFYVVATKRVAQGSFRFLNKVSSPRSSLYLQRFLSSSFASLQGTLNTDSKRSPWVDEFKQFEDLSDAGEALSNFDQVAAADVNPEDVTAILIHVSTLYWRLGEKRRHNPIIQMPQFFGLFRCVEKLYAENSFMSWPSQITLLKAYIRLFFEEPNIPLLQDLESHILTKLNSYSFGRLVDILGAFVGVPHQVLTNDLHRPLYTNVVKQIFTRFAEIAEPVDLVRLGNYILYFKLNNPDFVLRWKRSGMQLVENMTVQNCAKLVVGLSKLHERDIPLLRKCCYYMMNNPDGVSISDLSMKEISNLLYSFRLFRFHNPPFMVELLRTLVPKVTNSSDSAKLFSMICINLGSMRWRYPPLMDALCETLLSLTEEPLLLSAFVRYCANVNYVPEQFDSVLTHVLRHPEELRVQNIDLFINLVWSLACINKAPFELVDQALSKDIVDTVISEITNRKHRNDLLLKLLNINAAMCYDFPNGKSKLPSNFAVEYEIELPKFDREALTDFVAVISQMDTEGGAPYVLHNLTTPEGYRMDAVMLIDHNGALQPLTKENCQLAEQNMTYERVALMLLGFGDLTHGAVGPTGLHAMQQRHYERLGYKIFELRADDWNLRLPLDSKKEIIMRKLRSVSSSALEQKAFNLDIDGYSKHLEEPYDSSALLKSEYEHGK